MPGVDIVPGHPRFRDPDDVALSVDEMHEALAEQGVDVDAMQADCPMLTGSMANMHGTGGDHHGHHDTPGR